jgi:hypothetical protein
MMDISLAGLVGAIVGTVLAGISYHLFIGALEQGMRGREPLQTPQERDRFDAKMSLIRRVVLATDLLAFAVLGYVIGQTVWD